MKDHQKAALVNDLTRAIRQLWPDAPAQLRQTISTVVKKHTLACQKEKN